MANKQKKVLSTIPVSPETLHILHILAAGKNIPLRQLLDEFAEPYKYLLDQFKTNGQTKTPPKSETA